jgi:Subtilase family
MRRYLLWMVFGVVIGLSACATPGCPPPSSPPSIAPPIDTTKACASWQWIGITRPGSECPKVPGWTVSPLFEPRDSGNQQQYPQQKYPYQKEPYPNPQTIRHVPDPKVIQELERFCTYTIEDAKRLQDVPFPPTVSPELVRFDQDCAIVSTSASEYMDQTSGTLLREHFLKQVGRAGISPTFNGPPNVRLAFLDTHPTDNGTLDVTSNLPNSWHGYTLVQIARDLVHTPDGQRAARVTTQLALPIVSFDAKKQRNTKEDWERGGFIGTQSHLAQAINEEVNRWQREGSERHLVLNLSLAWDGHLFGGLDEERINEVRAGTQAVYRALQYAADHDVLVLAAAGNQRTPCAQQNLSGSCPKTGPLLPGAWEEKHPEDATCGVIQNRPLLYAVGGVQSNDTRLDNARPGARTRRAAYGEYPVVASYPNQPTKLYVGSSIATAVVSSIAAAVWDSFPDFDSHKIMEILQASGKDVGDSATFWDPNPPPAPPGPRVHKISFCDAVRAACQASTSAPCPIEAACPSWTPEPPPIRFHSTVPPTNSCQPWVFPQPEEFPCLGCPPKSG